jgi:hypothetical protein
MMKKFLVKINAYGYRTNFDIEAIDTAKSIEAAILDKIGKKRYKFHRMVNSSKVNVI